MSLSTNFQFLDKLTNDMSWVFLLKMVNELVRLVDHLQQDARMHGYRLLLLMGWVEGMIKQTNCRSTCQSHKLIDNLFV